MTDVPPDDESADAAARRARGQGPAQTPGTPPPAFDDDALADALEAGIRPYTQPITVIPPAQPVAPPPAAAAPPPPSAPYESEYEAPDVPEYIVPPAPPAPDYEVPPAPPAPPYELPEEPQAGGGGPSTLDAIQRLEDELRRQGLADAAAAAAASEEPAWEPALDHPEPGHVFPTKYPPFTDPVTIQQPPVAPEPPAAPEPIVPNEDWTAAPPPSFEPPPLVEPQQFGASPDVPDTPPPLTPPPTEGATYVAPTVLPPLREVRLEDVQGLPPPVGQQAAPLPPYDPNVPTVPGTASGGPAVPPTPPPPPAFGAPPTAPEPSAPAFAAGPDAFDLTAAAPPSVSPDSFAGAYATPVGDAASLGATEPASLDAYDDTIDDVDRIFGLPPEGGAVGAAGAFPSEPISTQRVTDRGPGLLDQPPENHPVFVVEHAGTEPTALDLRAGRAARLFWLWFATNSSVVSLAIGAVLISVGMSLRQAIVATLAGVALSFLPLGLGTLAGKWSGQPTMVVSRATFGHAGNLLPAFLAVLTRIFWGGVLLWLLATATGKLLVFGSLDAGMGEATWTYVVLGIGAVIAAVIALFGYGFVARLQLVLSILSGLLVAGLIYITFPYLDLDAALAVGDGAWTAALGGAVVVFAFVGLAWVQSSSDVARYQRPASSGAQSMLWATIGATLPPFALIVWGAMLAASDPDIGAEMTTAPLNAIARLLPLWYPAPLIAAAGLGLLSSIVLAIYSSGFALQAVGIKARRSATTIISAVLIAAAAAGLVLLAADAFSIARDLATTLAVPVAAWAGIFSAEMMIRTRKFDSPSLEAPGGVYPQVRVANFIGFILISALGYGLSTAVFPGLTWQGYLFPILGIAPEDPFAMSDVGVLVALVLGILVPLATAIPAIRKQERDGLKLEHTGPIPRITGSIPRLTGSIPRQTGPTDAAPPPS